MDPAAVADLAGVKIVSEADGRKAGDELGAAVRLAADRIEAAEAVARAMADPSTIAAMAAWAKAAPGEWAGLLAGLRAVRGMSAEVRALQQLVTRAQAPVRLVTSREAPEAPEGVPEGWEVPHRWYMDNSGLWVIVDGPGGTEEMQRVTTAPMWVTGRLVDVDTGLHSVELAWPAWDGSGLSKAIVDAATAADARGIVRMADQGAPVTSANARDVVRFVDAAAAANADILPVRRTASRMGWMPGGFMLGNRWIGDEDRAVTLTGDAGLTQLAAGYREAGTWEGWLEVYRLVMDRPAPMIALRASVASVLLSVCGPADCMIVEFAGRTSQGKSTVQGFAGSVWGRPARVARSWKGRSAGHEAYMAALRNLPPILDDTKKAHSAETVTEVVYMHSGGQGASRGAPGTAGRGVGMRAAEEWCSVMLSSGETRCTSVGHHAGAAARALVLWGSPLASGDQAKAVLLGCDAHHGHVGPRVLRWLLEGDHIEVVRAYVRDAEAAHARELEQHSAVAGRLASCVAFLDAAGRVLGEIGLPEPTCDILAACYDAARDGGAQADRPTAALLAVYDAAMSQPARLWHRGASEPSQGWIGCMDTGPWRYIALRPGWVDQELARAGYDREVVEEWKAREWIVVSSTGRPSVPTSAWLGSRPKMIRITREAIMAAGVEFDT